MVKIICIGDPHFQVNNIDDVEVFIDKIVHLVHKENPDFCVILGDVLHTDERLHISPLNKAYEFIDKVSECCLTFVLVGNHDMLSEKQYLNDNHWMNSMKKWKNVVIVDRVKYFVMNNEEFVFCPYVSTGRFIEALTSGNEDWKDANVIFAHQEFYGCKFGAIVSECGDKWDLSYPNIISGHIHMKHRPQKNIYYVGSSLQHAFGENEDNTVSVVRVKDREYTYEEIDLGITRKRIIYTNSSEISKININSEQPHKIKVCLCGTIEDFKSVKKTSKYKEMIDKGVKVVFKPDKILENKHIEIMSEKKTFLNILHSLVEKKSNKYITKVYENICKDK